MLLLIYITLILFNIQLFYVIICLEVLYDSYIKITTEVFDFIKDGTKRIELRLFDEKRQQININDIIEFKREPEQIDSLKVKVIGLLRYRSFEDLFEDFPIEILADSSMTKAELLNALEEFYTPEKQEKYGVLGIKIVKI